MRFVASAKRSRPSWDNRYSLSFPARRPSSQPSLARRAVAVRTSRSFSPKGAARVIKLPRATAPPRGMMASPKRVTMSEPPRSGRWRRNRPTSRAAAEALVLAASAVTLRDCSTVFLCDTEKIDLSRFLYQNILMYTQALDAQGSDAAAQDDGALEQRFLARVDAEE